MNETRGNEDGYIAISNDADNMDDFLAQVHAVVAHVADDVKVSILGRTVEMTILKKPA